MPVAFESLLGPEKKRVLETVSIFIFFENIFLLTRNSYYFVLFYCNRRIIKDLA